MTRRGAWIAPLAAAAFATSALARVGGGGGYSGGGGDGGGDDGAGIVFALVRLLLWLVFRHPVIGIPVLVIVVIVVWRMARSGRLPISTREHPRVFGEMGSDTFSPKRGLTPFNLTPVRASDALFSEPAFLDFAQLVFARGHEMRGDGRREPLEPWMSPRAIDALFADRADLEDVSEVIVGSTRLVSAATRQGFVEIEVAFEANVTELRRGARSQVLCEETWVFHRRAGVTSPPPSRLRALGCPGCGSTLEPKADGTCASCGMPRRGGQASWEVARIPHASRRPLAPPELARRGGVEEGTERPTRIDPRLSASRRAFSGRHPDHPWEAFEAHAREVFLRLQAAWSTQDWERARGDETDALYQTHRFWMERYRAFGLRNRVESVSVTRVVLSRIDVDAFYESITIRIFARALDWTEGADGAIVAGSKHEPTSFSEYWTFLRALAAEDAAPRSCPSCAARLDAQGPAAVCPYCGAKLEAASRRWVLSRIEQD